jgi:hypothetical protein
VGRAGGVRRSCTRTHSQDGRGVKQRRIGGLDDLQDGQVKDASGEEHCGPVSDVRVEHGNLFLERDNGKHVALDSVTDFVHAGPPAAAPNPAPAGAG